MSAQQDLAAISHRPRAMVDGMLDQWSDAVAARLARMDALAADRMSLLHDLEFNSRGFYVKSENFPLERACERRSSAREGGMR